jgi:hypothetical protein
LHQFRYLAGGSPELKLQEEFQFSYWKMETSSEEEDYLDTEVEIWPEAYLYMSLLDSMQKKKSYGILQN